MERFFVSGFNKSGTTFLQMLLDAHPAINCPSEHHFTSILQYLTQFSAHYEKQIESFDARTARQGVRFDRDRFLVEVTRSILVTLMGFGTGGETTHTGLNDNSLINNGDFFAAVMPEAKFLFIVRDPREVGVSLWHHRMRTEPDFAAAGTTLDKTVAAVGRVWPKHVQALLDFQGKHAGRAMILRYEDLISPERDEKLRAVLGFLGVAGDDATLRKLWDATDFRKLKAGEARETTEAAGFYRSGKGDSWRAALPAALKQEIAREAREALALFGYPLAD